MREQDLRYLLQEFKEGTISLDKIVEELKDLPYRDLGFAKVDYHRELRQNQPEVVFCPGKTSEQIVKIMQSLGEKSKNILATRADHKVYEAVKQIFPQAQYNELARIIVVNRKKQETNPGKILVVSAGTADLPVAEEAVVTAEVLGNKVERLYDVGVAGLHRLLANYDKLKSANVLIVVAGMEGALASVVGGLVDRPVLAVPTSVGYGSSFKGLTALLAMLNSCAAGVGVVNIDNGFGAACLAHQINSKPKIVNNKGGEDEYSVF